ncbi:hypothetical protein [Robbsia sp. KACC 23696]|uniref:hypothetical protein n=1 Tax=Robbsia sp. KACC 23696 TaxID=3149231 RepID=UPI00325A7AA6
MRVVANHWPFRKRIATRRAHGFVLLEWALAAALGLVFAVAVLAALAGFRRHTSAVAETAQLRADAAIALRFLRHYMTRAADPGMPGRLSAGRIECDTGDARPVSMWRASVPVSAYSVARRGRDSDGITRRLHCDLTSHRGRLTIDYPSDREASWRDVSNRPADCQGTALSAANTKPNAPPPQGRPMMQAALWISVSRGDVTPALFCKGSPDRIRHKGKQSGSAIVDGVERLALWRRGSYDEVCIVMRGRIRRAPTPMPTPDPPSGGASVRDGGSGMPRRAVRAERAEGDRCEAALSERGHYASHTDYVAPDGYRRHVIRAFWPAPTR